MASDTSESLFPRPDTAANPETDRTTGILPYQAIKDAIANREIQAQAEIDDEQIQPASLDLRLGPVAYRVRSSFLPGKSSTVQQKLESLAMHEIDLRTGAVLEKGCVYIVPLQEHLRLRKRSSALANPKSSTGRLDIFARLITDYGTEFDRVRERYQGPLYAEISPRTFSVLVRENSRLVQLRIRRGSPPSSDAALRRLHDSVGLVDAEPGQEDIKNGLAITVDLTGEGASGTIGYRAKKHAGLIDIDRVGHYDRADFWDPLHTDAGGALILDPGEFYILASRETVTVPADHAAEMIAYDTSVGEFRVHYAGFFDPGFGLAETSGKGTRAVLEVRSHEVPFLIEDGQTVGRLIYERLTAKPDKLYGAGIGSSYQRQGLALSKHFKP
ncbi:MAG: 2'-deoxycytidine 5'-triphosphate deaminase [Alphaproteobacteria bacterium]